MELAPLYVPGDRPDRFAKALAASPHVILDLEDAVAPSRKDYARAAVTEALAGDHPFTVRVNAPGSPWHEADLAAIAGQPALRTVRLPKVESPTDVTAVVARLEAAGAPTEVGIACLRESAVGVEAAFAIAGSHPRVRSISLGEADLRSDLGLPDSDGDPEVSDEGLAWCRSRIVVAARAAGLPPPVMSVHPHGADLDGLAATSRAGRRLGFVGRTCIHPRQVPVVVGAFRPTGAELDRARELLDALAAAEPVGRGVLAMPDGRMVDPAMAGAARRALDLAAAAARYPSA
jgi:citrate lyase subunit beta/citryl-CoA lyase